MTTTSGPAPRPLSAAGSPAERLRRYDWRFLLPAPADGSFGRIVIVGRPAGVAEDLVRLGVAREATVTPPDAPTADAVVALRGARVRPEEARAWLREGGVLLLEVDRRAPGRLAATPARVRKALARAGFETLGCWWAKPDLERCGMYLPLESDGALEWYHRRHHAPRSTAARALARAIGWVTGWKAARFARWVPTFVVVARAGAARDGGVGVLGGRGVPTSLLPPRSRPLLLLGGEGAWSRVVVLPFGAGADRPVVVVKHPRLARYNAATRRERTTLKRIRARVGGPLRASLPMPVAAGRWRGLSVAAERCVAGRSVYAACASGGEREAGVSLRLAASWLAAFHVRTVVARPPLDALRIERLLARPVARYTAALGCEGAERALFDEARARAERVAGTTLPIVWQHRDFGPWNVHRDGRRIAVIDWEVARPGPALCDLLYFTLHWSWLVRGHRAGSDRRRDFEALFLDPGRGGAPAAACRRAIARYMERLEIAPALAPLLLLHLLLEQALDRVRRLRAVGARAARDDNPYVGYLGVLAGRPDRLFEREWP
ncbi:MAG TPA: aminoglycoside phosphotransferase family protein [Longimicrobiales bacterium]